MARFNNILTGKYYMLFYIFVLSCILYILSQFYGTILISKLTILLDNRFTKNNTTYYYYRSSSYNKTKLEPNVFLYYHHATSGRNSSYPFISGDTFRAFSDYVYDETRTDNLSSVKYGEIVFVKTDMLSNFFTSSFESIREPFVLISHNSDYSAPGRYEKYLSDPKVLHWYASNLNVKNLQKISPIPIGLANTRWPQGNLDNITFAFKNHRKPWSQRTTFLYVNFAVGTNVAQRTKALSQASTIKDVEIVKEKITFETYLEQIGNSKFVLSPPGNGLDCHRTWEALLMGAVPIVLASGLDPLFTKTRSIIINDWSKLSYNFLSSFNSSLDDNYEPDVLYAEYWRETLFKYRKKTD
ncbi:unnamed protein product [Adineta steineri]|uniref:Exostosin GT47 domain-containing protein n=1 Tax=Adineta steineri TaxID=433720 RepID=A0A813RR62_9BILA|nr:unnamed protein product [Adineta steineri]CAF1041257.1 unnamed protein product [Adineta steineri]